MYLFEFCAIVSAAFGLFIGSFLNAVIYRIPRGISVVAPRSSCVLCGARLTPAELVPVLSFIVQRGRCRSCGDRISWRYPLTELLAGALWGAAFFRFGLTYEFFCYAALLSIFSAIFFIDIEFMRIPNKLVISAMIPAMALCARYAFFLSEPQRFVSTYRSISVWEPLFGLVPSAFFAVVYIITAIAGKGKSAIGMGDIKLFLPAGLSLGLSGSVYALFVSVILGGVTGVVLIALGIKNKKDPIPFGPFIVIGVAAAIFFPVVI